MYIIILPQKIYRTMWGTGANSTVGRLLDTNLLCQPIICNIAVTINPFSPIIQFLAGISVKAYISIRPETSTVMGIHAALHKRCDYNNIRTIQSSEGAV